jgi:hypothetical protein
MGVAQEIPSWWAPSAEVIRDQGHTFFTKAWLVPILLVAVGLIVSRLDQYGLGYVLYRITSDVEELPFPMAPVAASGITALAQTKENQETWRWRCFSIGAVLGLVFGAFYIGVPAVTGTILDKPIQLLPIPWVDFTPAVSKFLPATPVNLSFNIIWFFQGMVLPFWAVVGGFLGVVFTMCFNPVLYHQGVLSHWNPQMDVINTIYSNNVDFYLSFSLGLTLAITAVSLGRIVTPLLKALRGKAGNARELSRRELGERKPSAWRRLVTNDTRRGDFSIFIALGIYLSATCSGSGCPVI